MQKLQLLLSLTISLLALQTGCVSKTSPERPEAGRALQFWNMARMYPDGRLHTDRLVAESKRVRALAAERGGPALNWEALGPKNIGGRTLCLAIHPLDSNILFMGSASGGLWKSTTGGKGANAWTYVETGFPVLGVGAIAMDPANPQVMYIGTGEVYNLENSMPNVAYRTTRGTYGIGILKTSDGGLSWETSLDWSYEDLTGVQEIRINPLRPETVWAATTEGLYRSYDAGATWTNVLEQDMAVDLEISPIDTSTLFVTFGSLDDNAVSGIYRSTDAGENFVKLTNGLPLNYSGKTLVSIAPSNPNILYASIGDAFVQRGLYRSLDGGATWSVINTTDVCRYQGWYSHDVAIKPDNPNHLVWGGIDMWVSTDGGGNVTKTTNWSSWYFGQVPAGAPEGPSNYVHADIHHIYFHPEDHNKVYGVTDGGLFVSSDAGVKWQGRNGGYQTQQFYANFSNSATNPNIAIGGMQDNATAIYTGDPSWRRVIGGDGCCTAINPFDDNIMYASAQNANLRMSGDGGQSWSGFPAPSPAGVSAFVAPFELAPSNPEWFYLGEDMLCRFDFLTGEWAILTPPHSIIITIGIQPNDAEDVYFSTAPGNGLPPAIFHLNAATLELTEMSGLPDRMCMDIARHPWDANTVYAVFSGFGTEHLWRTTDGGQSWQAVPGLPDVPTNSVLIDPLNPEHLYVANDLGVWYSPDAGDNWLEYGPGTPSSFLAMHLSISADRHLRVATHGSGVWQALMAAPSSVADIRPDQQRLLSLYPNPARGQVQLNWHGAQPLKAFVSLTDAGGRVVLPERSIRLTPNEAQPYFLQGMPTGRYQLRIADPAGGVLISKTLLVQ